jgi:hypothetical protein
VETLPKGGAFTATSEPAQSPAPATPSEDTTMPRDILTADPLTLSDTEHAELVSAWDAALTKALDEGGAPSIAPSTPPPSSPATSTATGRPYGAS